MKGAFCPFFDFTVLPVLGDYGKYRNVSNAIVKTVGGINIPSMVL